MAKKTQKSQNFHFSKLLNFFWPSYETSLQINKASCETGFNKVKLSKVGSNARVPARIGAGPNKLYIKIV